MFKNSMTCQLLEFSMEAELAKASATALALGKKILNQTFERSAHEIFDLGSQAQAICCTSAEHRAAVMALLVPSASKE
jgi:2-(1,2-epoxy-1,2-dihydrophenyl)acetyl-CoA isomerase